ncbi:MAG: GNAT family N-acetyltransferase, partial [Anaerolineaceae bacterium]
METKPPYQIERLETPMQLDALEKEWAELITEIPEAPVFLSWEWIRTWWFYFGDHRELWLLTARDTQGRLLGIAPLLIERQRIGLLPLRVIGFIGIGLTRPVNLNILTHPSDPKGILQAFLDFLLGQSKQWDVIRLFPMSKDAEICTLLNNGNGRFRTGVKTVNAYIPLPDSWDAYAKTLTKKLRRNLKYFRTKLEDDYPGGVRFAYLTDPHGLPAVMNKMEELNKGRWVSKKRVSNYAYSNYSAFHEAFAMLMLERGWLRLNQLIVSGN